MHFNIYYITVYIDEYTLCMLYSIFVKFSILLVMLASEYIHIYANP